MESAASTPDRDRAWDSQVDSRDRYPSQARPAGL